MERSYDEELEKLLREIPDEVDGAHDNTTQQQCMSHENDDDEAVLIMATPTHLPHYHSLPSQQKLHVAKDMAGYADYHTSGGSPFTVMLPLDVPVPPHNLPPQDCILRHRTLPDHAEDRSSISHNDSLNTIQRYSKNGTVSRSPTNSVNLPLVSTTSDSSILSRLPSSLQLDEPFPHDRSDLLAQELQSRFKNVSLAQDDIGFLRDVAAPVEGPQPAREASLEPSRSSTNAMKMQLGFHEMMTTGAHPSPPFVGMLPSYASGSKMVYAQQLHDARYVQRRIEEKTFCRQRIKEELLLRQQHALQEQQARFYCGLHNPSGASHTRSSVGLRIDHLPTDFNFFQQHPSPKAALAGAFAPHRIPSTQAVPENPLLLAQDLTPSANTLQCCLHGLCAKEDSCATSCAQRRGISVNGNFIVSDNGFSQLRRPNCNVQPASYGLIFKPPDAKDLLVRSSHSNSCLFSNGTRLPLSNHFSGMNGGAIWKGINPEVLQHDVSSQLHVSQPQLSPSVPKYTTLKEVEGHIYGIAKDQHGCRFLQKKFEEGVSEDLQKIFVEIIDHVVELMTDPFGNYLVQKLLDVCDEAQLMEILHRVTRKDQLVSISLNMHGTRAVQKLIETFKTPEQIGFVISSLSQNVVTLMKDLNGNHVVQRCLQCLSTEDNKFIFIAAALHCVEIATHRHGCCVLQRCIDFSTGQQREHLVSEITANSLILSQDPFGNYVVQYILDLGLTGAVTEVITRLKGNFVQLAMQKFSSNVVEKCLKLGDEESKTKIIAELMSNTRLVQLLQDPFANYVVQAALTVSKGHVYVGLIEAIRPHLPALRSSPYGKRILSRMSLRK